MTDPAQLKAGFDHLALLIEKWGHEAGKFTSLCVMGLVLLSGCKPAVPASITPPLRSAQPGGTGGKTATAAPTQTPAAVPARTSLPPSPTAGLPTPVPPPSSPPIAQPEYTPTPDGDIAQAQDRLLELGYGEVGWVDGFFSDQTGAAVRHFQYLNGLESTGVLDERTRTVLFDPSAVVYRLPPPFPGLIIEPGVDFGDDQALHARLAELEYIAFDEEEWILNQYGPVTQDAVLRFQENNGLAPSGVVDLETWRALFSPWAVPASGQASLGRPSPDAWNTTIFPVGENPFALAYDGQRLWVAHQAQGSYLKNFILAIDPSQGASDLPAPIFVDEPGPSAPHPVGGMLSAEDRLWLLFPNEENPGDPPFIRSMPVETGVFDPPVAYAQCPDGFCFPSSAFGFDGSLIWASAGDQVVAIDPAISQPVQTHQAGWLAHGGMLFAQGCMWMGAEAGLTAFSPSGGECPFSEMAYALPGDALAFDGRRIWGASTTGGFITSLDLETGELGDLIEIGSGPRALAFDGIRLWVAQEENNSLVVVDVDSGTVSRSLRVGERPVALLYDDQQLWAACAGNHTVQVIDPHIYLTPQGTPSESPSFPEITPSTTATFSLTPHPTATLTATPTVPLQERTLQLTTPSIQGDDVLLLQTRLLELGYHEVGELDGVFGPLTEQAVRHFQQVNGLAVDGVVGPQTWALLFSPDAKSP